MIDGAGGDLPEQSTLAHQWANGGRPIILAVALAIIIVAIGLTVLLVVAFWSTPDFAPIHDAQPPRLVGEAVPGQPAQFASYACIDERVDLFIASQYQQGTPGQADFKQVPGANPLHLAGVPPQCSLSTLGFTLPEGLTSGRWELVLTVRATARGHSQDLSLTSRPFMVSDGR